MDNKKSFILYKDLIHTVDKLPDDKAGLLFKHILHYVNGNEPTSDDILIDISFEPIKQQLKRDLKKYENICNRNKANGSKGGRPKKPKKPNGLLGNPKKPQKADSDNDNDNDSDNVNDIYNLYPTKCPIKKRNLGKGEKSKIIIRKLLKTKSVESIKGSIESYIKDCTKSNTWFKGFNALLNDLPDFKLEPTEKTYVYKWNNRAEKRASKKQYESDKRNYEQFGFELIKVL